MFVKVVGISDTLLTKQNHQSSLQPLFPVFNLQQLTHLHSWLASWICMHGKQWAGWVVCLSLSLGFLCCRWGVAYTWLDLSVPESRRSTAQLLICWKGTIQKVNSKIFYNYFSFMTCVAMLQKNCSHLYLKSKHSNPFICFFVFLCLSATYNLKSLCFIKTKAAALCKMTHCKIIDLR